jgi:alcohol dehydrogenase class IV
MKYQFQIPTKVFFGEGCLREQVTLFSEVGKKAMIVCGKNSSKLNGSLADVIYVLESNQMGYYLFDEVKSNPLVDDMLYAAGIARRESIDCVIGIGGGSPLDAAKAIALLINNDLNEEGLYDANSFKSAVPIIAIPTTAGTGSEVTNNAVLTTNKLKTKQSVAHVSMFPKYSFLDPIYTETLPVEHTIHTAIDAFSHAMEGYLAVRTTVMSQVFALEAMKIVGDCIPALKSMKAGSPLDRSIREKLLHASMLAGMTIAHTGTTALHAMGYSLTYFKGIDHGRANALLMSSYLEFIAKAYFEKVNTVLELFGAKDLQEFSLNMHVLLGEFEKIEEEELEKFAASAIKARSIANTLTKPNEADLVFIFKQTFN